MGASLQVSFFFSFLPSFFFLPLILYHALYFFIFLRFFFSLPFPLLSFLFPLPSSLSFSYQSFDTRVSTPCIDARTSATHTRDNKRMRSTIQNGILSAKIENINFDSATRHAFSFNGVQCNAIYRGKQRTIKSPLWKILALLASELYRLTTKTYFVSKPRNR